MGGGGKMVGLIRGVLMGVTRGGEFAKGEDRSGKMGIRGV